MNKTLLIIAATLTLSLTSFAQRPDLNKFEVIGQSDISTFLISNDVTRIRSTATFQVVIAQTKESDDDTATLDPNNWLLSDASLDCDKGTYQLLKTKGLVDGRDVTLGKQDVKLVNPKSFMGLIMTSVCGDKGLFT